MIDNIPEKKGRGLNRVTWSRHEKPPGVPPAAQIAASGVTTSEGGAIARQERPRELYGAILGDEAKPNE